MIDFPVGNSPTSSRSKRTWMLLYWRSVSSPWEIPPAALCASLPRTPAAALCLHRGLRCHQSTCCYRCLRPCLRCYRWCCCSWRWCCCCCYSCCLCVFCSRKWRRCRAEGAGDWLVCSPPQNPRWLRGGNAGWRDSVLGTGVPDLRAWTPWGVKIDLRAFKIIYRITKLGEHHLLHKTDQTCLLLLAKLN